MAIMTTGGVGFDFRTLNVVDLLTYDFASLSPTELRLFDNPSTYISFTGSGFVGTVVNDTITSVTAGTVTGIQSVDLGANFFTVTGANASAVSLFAAYAANNTAAFINLVLAGNDTINGTSGGDYLRSAGGNDVLLGFGGADTLLGEIGNDLLRGGDGKDTLDGGVGVDTAAYGDKAVAVAVTLNGATAVNVTVGGIVEDSIKNIENVNGGSGNDTLIGDALANSFVGNGGNDYFRGGGGKDVMDGGVGVDTAAYGDKAVAVVVTLNGATAVNVTIGGVIEDSIKNIENVAGGAGNDVITGDALANSVTGNAGLDTLNGGTNNDVLNGGLGNDTLTGGANNDTFRFDSVLNAVTNKDNITDFNVAADTMQLENAIFTLLTAGAVITAAQFKDISTSAQDVDDVIIYNKATGNLFYDSNGLAGGGLIQFAHVTAGTALTNLDFFVT